MKNMAGTGEERKKEKVKIKKGKGKREEENVMKEEKREESKGSKE